MLIPQTQRHFAHGMFAVTAPSELKCLPNNVCQILSKFC